MAIIVPDKRSIIFGACRKKLLNGFVVPIRNTISNIKNTLANVSIGPSAAKNKMHQGVLHFKGLHLPKLSQWSFIVSTQKAKMETNVNPIDK